MSNMPPYEANTSLTVRSFHLLLFLEFRSINRSQNYVV